MGDGMADIGRRAGVAQRRGARGGRPKRLGLRRIGTALVAAVMAGGLLATAPGVAQGAVSAAAAAPVPSHVPGGPNNCRTSRPDGAESLCTIINDTTGLVVEVFAHSGDENARTVIWSNYGGSSERFIVRTTSGLPLCCGGISASFKLVAQHSRMCLTGQGSWDVVGRTAVMKTCGSAEGRKQSWFLREIPMTPSDCPSGQCFAVSRFVLVNSWT